VYITNNFFHKETYFLIIPSNSCATVILIYVTYIVIKFHLLCNIFLRNHDNKTYADKKLSSDYSEDSDSSSTYRKYISLQSFAHDSMCICSCICTKRNCYQCNRIVAMSPPSYFIQNFLSVSVYYDTHLYFYRS